MRERTTSQAAREIGVAADVLRKWKYRKLLKLAPQGISGQGRSVECLWSEEAFAEAKKHAETWKSGRPSNRKTRP